MFAVWRRKRLVVGFVVNFQRRENTELERGGRRERRGEMGY